MKKAIKALWHGIKAVFSAVVDWVATLLGMNESNKYSRVLRSVVGTAIAVVIIVWAVTALVRFTRSICWNLNYTFLCFDLIGNVEFSEQLGDNLLYYSDCCGDKGYLTDSTGHKVLKHILCINKPLEGDSLVYFSDGDKRGYFDMRDGRLVVKPIYEHAWIFSEGLAAVEVNGRIKFIDTEGRVVIDQGFAYDENDDGYVFHNGHCAVNDKDGKHMGLIDRNGDWVLPPVYENIFPSDTFWLVRTSDEQAILTFSMDTLFPLTKGRFDVCDTAIFVTYADHTQSLFTLQGKLLADNMIRSVDQLMYETCEVAYPEWYEEDSYDGYDPYARKAVATCRRYEAECGWYGLMSLDGRLLTPPSYYSIEAVDKDLYLCETSYGHGVILNSKGVRIR